MLKKLFSQATNDKIHWTTLVSEKILLALIGIATCIAAALYIWGMFLERRIELSDLFLLFIYAEILGMVGSFYSTNRIPVTLPIIIAITAICRLIVMQNKEMEATLIVGEAAAVLILAGAAYMMSLKDKISLEKLKNQKNDDVQS
ncbi:MAG: phosphate-starvation-inducible PsiE family protein [Gammaproteobacteria bacterium]|tara:strand:+ start:988 stop:1422 length:435 start_codon:yes stop_codon:yes gene_type:complete